ADEVKRKNKAAIMVTHDERVLDLVDRVIRIEDGYLKAE
ncbi:ABC transporter, ATP-binding protein, partial [Listeria innocua FSL S4-378]